MRPNFRHAPSLLMLSTNKTLRPNTQANQNFKSSNITHLLVSHQQVF
ncbi:hypothetical protein [Chryseolinea soli]|nr:hypothetical protein [Chryseolinea soli]